MTLIELLWFMFWVGGGAVAGMKIALAIGFHTRTAGILSAVVGAVVSFTVIGVLTWLNDRINGHRPPCRCGLTGEFTAERDHGFMWTDRCRCGKRYIQRKGWLWFEVQEDNTAHLYLKQDIWGHWVPATEKDIANKRLQRYAGSAALHRRG
ncbi:MAG: hypothetical protein NTV49_12215 [Kiritimatiellaeota bacterium]|nr:hypothetical protein [Kiritimatiellota bacterium]